jgi:hypothetical protein
MWILLYDVGALPGKIKNRGFCALPKKIFFDTLRDNCLTRYVQGATHGLE